MIDSCGTVHYKGNGSNTRGPNTTLKAACDIYLTTLITEGTLHQKTALDKCHYINLY